MTSQSHEWRKSSYSGNPNNECVEVAPTAAAWAVRDTKDRDGGTLEITPSAWRALLHEIR